MDCNSNDIQGMIYLLSNLLNCDNEIRSKAEIEYNSILKQNPSLVASTLVSCIAGNQNHIQTSALVLLRQIVRNHWSSLSSIVIENVLKKELLKIFDQSAAIISNITNGNVNNSSYIESFQRKLSSIFISFPNDHLGTFSTTLLPHLLQNLENQISNFNSIQSNSGQVIVSIAYFIEKLAEVSFVTVFTPRVQILQKIIVCYFQLIQNQKYNDFPNIKLSVCRSVISIIVNSPEPRDFIEIGRALPKSILGSILQLSSLNFSKNNDEDLVDISKLSLESLSQLSELCFWAFENDYGLNCVSLLSISSSQSANTQIRCLSTQILSDLFAKRGKLVIQDETFLKQTLQTLIKMLCEDEEFEQEWIDQQKSFSQDPSLLTSDDIILRTWPGIRSFALDAIESLINSAASTLTATKSNKKNKNQNNSNGTTIGMNFLSIYFDYIKILLASGSSIEKHAGLTCICLALGPFSKKIWTYIKDIVNGACMMISANNSNELNDIRVQYAAITCLHEIFSNESISKVVARTMHGSIMPVLIASLSSSRVDNAVVTNSVCLTISQFCQHITSDYAVDSLNPYLDNLIQSMTQLISNANTFSVQVNALDTLGSMAKLVPSDFGKYYDNLMPGLKVVLSTSKSMSPLRRSSMMCIATIAESVPKQKFLNDAPLIIQYLFSDINAGNGNNNIIEKADEFQALFDFSKRACLILKDDFVSFLPNIIPVLVVACSINIGVEIEPTNEMPEDLDGDQDDSEKCIIQHINGVGNFKVKANVYAIQLKISAIECIDGFADILGSSFFPFVEPCASVILPAITEKSLTSIKVKAAEGCTSLLHSACLYLTDCDGKKNQDLVNAIQKFFVTLVTTLTTCVYEASIIDPASESTQDEDDRRLGFITSLERCTRISYYSGTPPIIYIPQNMIPPFITTLIDTYKQSVTRRSDEISRLQKMGYDNDDADRFASEIEEIEVELSKEIIDAIGWVIKVNGHNFLSSFDQLIVPIFSKLLNPTLSSGIHHNALCLYSDVIQYCGPIAAEKYGAFALENMMKFCLDSDPLIRLVCVYAIGIIAELVPSAFSKKINDALQVLHKVACSRNEIERSQTYNTSNNNDESTEDDDKQVSLEVAECAIFTIGKICRLYGGNQTTYLSNQLEQQYLSFWAQSLPLYYDEEGAKYSHKLLIQYVSEKNPIITHPNGIGNIARVLNDIAVIVNKNNSSNKENSSCIDLIDQDDFSKIGLILSTINATSTIG